LKAGQVGINAMMEPRPARDFSDVAIWRGSLVALVVGYALSAIATAMSASLVDFGLALSMGADPGWDVGAVFATVQYNLRYALNPLALVTGFCGMCVVLVVGYFVMAAYRGDHTTYVAAAIIGVRTGAIGCALLLLVLLPLSLGSIFGAIGDVSAMLAHAGGLLASFVQALAVGALTGLAARIAAGAPTLQPANEPAGEAA
jgi:hypothetical protein